MKIQQMKIKAQDMNSFLDNTLSLTIDDALSMALTEVTEDNILSDNVYENLLSKLGETEQAAFTMGLVDKGIEVMANTDEMIKLKNAFINLANKQGCVYEDDYHNLCYGKDTMLISKICDWLLSAGVPLHKNKPKGPESLKKRKLISDDYKEKVTNQVKHPNVRSMGTKKIRVSSLEHLNIIEKAKDKDVETNYLPSWKKMEKGKVLFAGKQFNVAIAKTQEDLSSGLEVVSKLEKDEGMLFPFVPKDHVTFHMGKVKFPIDILFLLDEFVGFKVAKIIHNAQPGALETWSYGKTAYVLEVPGGSCKKHNININDAYEVTGI